MPGIMKARFSIKRVIISVVLVLWCFSCIGIAVWPFIILALEPEDAFFWPCGVIVDLCRLHWSLRENLLELTLAASIVWGVLLACTAGSFWLLIRAWGRCR